MRGSLVLVLCEVLGLGSPFLVRGWMRRGMGTDRMECEGDR